MRLSWVIFKHCAGVCKGSNLQFTYRSQALEDNCVTGRTKYPFCFGSISKGYMHSSTFSLAREPKINGVSLRGGFSSRWTIFMPRDPNYKTKTGAVVVEINEQKSFDLLEITLVCLVINGAVAGLVTKTCRRLSTRGCCGNWLR